MQRALIYMSPVDAHLVLTGHLTAVNFSEEPNGNGAMIVDIAATHPTNKLMGHAVGHFENGCLVLSKPFRLEHPEDMPEDHNKYSTVINDRKLMN